jgi:hypothetical protein
MPNWCSNEVDIIGDKETIKQVLEVVKNKDSGDGKFRMNDFVPMPEELSNTEAPKDTPNWYNWCVSNWGTKWEIDVTYFDFEETKIGLGFDTAWSPNCEFWTTFSEKYPTLEIYHRYYEEGMSFIGEAFYKDGMCNDNCQDITDKIWERAGAVLDKDGEVDWDKSDVNLYSVFPLGGK